MKNFVAVPITLLLISLSACAPFESITMHDLASGYHDFKTKKNESSRVYTDVYEDSLVIYPVKRIGSGIPDTGSG